MVKKSLVTYRCPVAKAMLQDRKSPQVVPAKRGNKAKRSRKKDKLNAINDFRKYADD